MCTTPTPTNVAPAPALLKAHQLTAPAQAVLAIQQGRACAVNCPSPCAAGVAKQGECPA